MSQQLYEILASHLTDRKRNLFEKIIADRTRYITFVLEDIYQAQNASAIQRSAESWGIQDLHVIENTHSYNHHRRIARGATDWLTLHRYNRGNDNTYDCITALKNKGYQVAVTSLGKNSMPVYQLEINRPTAVVMGTELTGASERAIELADHLIYIPTYGFTESLNVAAASAIIMQYFCEKMRAEKRAWQLTPSEQLDLKIQWAKKSIYWSKHIVEMYEAGEIP